MPCDRADVMARVEQRWHQMGAHVSACAGDENFHVSLVFVGAGRSVKHARGESGGGDRRIGARHLPVGCDPGLIIHQT